MKNKALYLIVTLLALLAAGQTALAETKTYTVSGGNGNSQAEFYAQFTDGSTLTDKVSWTYNSTAEISFNLGTNLALTLSETNKHLVIRNNDTGDAIGGQGATTLTVSGNNYYYIYHVRLLTADGNVIQLDANGNAVNQGGVSECDYWNMTKSFSHTFANGILFSKIEVSYATAIPITDAVISGIDNSYVVSDTPVKPVPTAVTWHGTTLTKDTHYTLSWNHSSSAGTAAVNAIGKGIFSTSSSASKDYTLVWATYNVRFNKNSDGASGTMSDQAFTYNSAQNLTANTFTAPTGYLFAGWATNADGTGNTYTDSQIVSNLTATNGATVDLYAQWTPISWEGDGSGTADNPYQISNYAELKQFANIVNVTGGEAYAKLVADIVCKNGPDDMEYATDWVPIGNASQPYTGTFDGQGYTITGLSTPNNNSSDYVGLFGYMGSGGVVQDVILEDATITGNNHVGVIAGYNNGGTLTRNYYVSCSVKSASTNIGTGSGDCNGARSVHALSLPANVTASGESVQINSAAYFAAGTTVTLSYSGTVPDGYFVSYSYNDGSDHAITGNTFTMPAANVTVSAQHISNVRYIDGNGIEQVCSNYTIIQSSNSRQFFGDSSNKEAWYVVAGDVTVEGGIIFYDRPALILCDGATLTVIADNENGITSRFAFTIYGQSGGTGSVSATGHRYGIRGEFSVTITGGNVSAIGSTGISSGEAITITGGTVSATGSNYGIIGNQKVTISGGNVTATGDQHEGILSSTGGIYLGWTNTSDSITASSYSRNPQISSQRFIDDDGITYFGSISRDILKGKTLRPYLSPTEGTPVTLVQGTKDGVTAWWGTFCNTDHYVLSEGAAAYTLGSDYKLYRLGVDGRTIPKNTAVVIIASEATIQTYDIGSSSNLLVTDHAPGGNRLQGSDSAVAVSGLSGTPYVLSKDANDTIGFRRYTGDAIPANKAYYVVQPTP